MRDVRAEVVHDVAVEYNGGGLAWTHEDVGKLIAPYPPRGQFDTVPDDEGDDWDPPAAAAGPPAEAAEDAGDELEEHQRRITWLEQVLSDTAQLHDDQLEMTIRRALHASVRRARHTSHADPAVATTLYHRHLDDELETTRRRRLVEDACNTARAAKRDRARLAAEAERLKRLARSSPRRKTRRLLKMP